jgi:hypothetical protein
MKGDKEMKRVKGAEEEPIEMKMEQQSGTNNPHMNI